MRDAKAFINSQLEKNVSLLDLYRDIQKDLGKVEDTLKLFTESENPIISEISDYLFKKAGKRIRQTLAEDQAMSAFTGPCSPALPFIPA